MTIDELRKFCLSLPATEEDIKWGHDLCFTVGAKMFCVTSMESPLQFSFKCTDEDFEILWERKGIIPAPYMARNKWVQVQETDALSKSESQDYIRISYNMVSSKLPKKVRNNLGFK